MRELLPNCSPAFCCKGTAKHQSAAAQEADNALEPGEPGANDASAKLEVATAQSMSRSLKQESGKARAQSLARRTATKVLQRGALQLLAAKLCVEESAVRQYVWNGTWLESRPLAKSRRLSERAARLEEELPEIFAHWGQRRLLRVGIALLACHPVVQILHLSFHTTSAKRAVIFTAFLSGSLAVSGLFMSASGAALDSTSDLECTIDENVMQFVVIGLVSMLLNALPRMCLDRMGRRSFAPETKASSQWRAWLRNDVLFWLLAAALLSFYLLFICSFLANIAKSEDWKCTVSFATILVGKLCTTPATRVCIQLSCAEATLFLFPDLTARELGLHAHGQAGQASDASQKVVELANRGIRVRHLLDFYEKVLQRDFFDPDRSTTHDVVRHAIIPWSLKVSTTWCDADEVQLELKAVDAQVPQEFGDVAKSLTSSSESESLGAAYATVVNGEPVAALKLVIHGWGNLFRTLLAAVFADALGHTDYDETLELLREQGLKTIRAQLSSLNKMDFPYWICAFSVNQHAGICGQPPETDSIGRSIAACGCETPKHRTGDECETNKFHELVEYMCKFNSEERKAGREMQRLGQVVAVDIGFNLFNRLWCVAELSHAEKLHLPQALKLHSSGSKERCFEKLHHLDVQAAEVTYEEDREVVLEKIGDSELFNEELKGLMFNQLDGFLFSERGKLNLEELVSRVVDSL